ncbi:hypothetical protein A3I48_04385 [Candidatus Daviesbacteria bacterium RIFCSPLOWO2_02_FULL_36_7]|uniref:Membrane protein 6-pyruvoyl-tetrahydropterin synthase-related domain-containing protein n=1 Tax=Candidatus Daviesbacteria bacterium RIFCSPLOWO2_02_FULL_36_7 TaxID=1797792 RepID=A0A1F5MHK6_9BACT|nr:MAG: hypothetical protein A3I48_04385 [Candidatus Daviesbacteria bacterium RIFCSPLOWO2_02_FULL_36_7]
MIFKEISVIFLLLLISFPAVRSLLLPGGFTSHDLTHHVVRQIDMDRLLSEGQFPPRWSGELNNGYGYPLFIFNYPLPPLIGEAFHKLGFNFLDSVKAVLFLSFVTSTLGMYLFLKSLFNSYLSAFLGAIFYLYAPIHLIVVYVSGSPGASMGLVFPPFMLWAIVKLSQAKSKKFLLIGSFSFAGMILSHNISAFIFMPVILAFVIVLKLTEKKRENQNFLSDVVLMFLFGLGLSAFFWLPAIAEKQYIRYDALMQRIYLDQFPALSQIIYSPWGYGLSHPKSPAGGMSYQVGLAHLGVMILLLSQLWRFRKVKKFLLIGVFAIIFFISSIFFMLAVSQPLWDKLPFLSYVQFPVRLAVIPVFCAALTAGLLVKYLPWRRVCFLFLLFLVLYANRNHLGINQKYDPGEQYYLSLKTSATSFDEDLPIWVNKLITDVSTTKFSFLSGGGKIEILENKSARVLAKVEATASARVRFNQYYFPGWEIKVDEEKINFSYSAPENNGMPVFDIEKGSHLIKAEFKNTPLRNLANGISIITVIIVIIILCKLLLRSLQKAKESS